MKFCENSVKLVNSNVEWIVEDYAWDIAFYIEKIARNGTQTQNRDNAMTRPIEFCRNAWNARPRHSSIFEFVDLTFQLNTSIAVGRELIRHRLCSFNEKSTRYCDESNLEVILPYWWKDASAEMQHRWTEYMECAERFYQEDIKAGMKRQEARGALPLDAMTSVYIKANLVEWSHILRLRCDKAAHPDMRDLMNKVKMEIGRMCPWMEEAK